MWAKTVHSRNQSTIITYVKQLADGNILVVGSNTGLHDIALFTLDGNGKLIDSSIMEIRGVEVPVGVAAQANGLKVAVLQKMPSGEKATIVLNLDKKGKLEDAARYHYPDGFAPHNIVALTSHSTCLYGETTARDKPQSIAIILNQKRLAVSALIMKGENVFNSAAQYRKGTIIFAGYRDLGVKKQSTPLLTLWTPRMKNDRESLKKIRRDGIKIKLHSHANAKISPWNKQKLHILKPEDLPFRSIYRNTAQAEAQ